METAEGSNTAITDRLISIGVTERISVTPSMFTQPGRESSSEDEEVWSGGGGRKKGVNASLSPFIHSVVNEDILSFVYLCIHSLRLQSIIGAREDHYEPK